MNARKLFNSLLSRYGNQNWWPVTDSGSVVPAYKPRKRLAKKQKLEICIGAILTQNTSWKNVERAIINLNKAKMVSVDGILSAGEKNLAELIKPSGYFNQKAKKLRLFAKHIQKNHGGSLNRMLRKPARELREELLSLWGIGEETADSILCYAAGKDVFVADAYSKRIAERFYGKRFNSYAELKEFFESRLRAGNAPCAEFHALLVEHAKRFCAKTRPKCEECPINKNCYYYKE